MPPGRRIVAFMLVLDCAAARADALRYGRMVRKIFARLTPRLAPNPSKNARSDEVPQHARREIKMHMVSTRALNCNAGKIIPRLLWAKAFRATTESHGGVQRRADTMHTLSHKPLTLKQTAGSRLAARQASPSPGAVSWERCLAGGEGAVERGSRGGGNAAQMLDEGVRGRLGSVPVVGRLALPCVWPARRQSSWKSVNAREKRARHKGVREE